MDVASLLHIAISVSIMLVVLGLGLHARWQDALYLFFKPDLLIRSLLSMNVIMPLVAAGLVFAFDLPTAVKISLVALAVSPVPPLVPRKELAAGAYASYAISLFFTTAVLAIVTVPLAVALFARVFDDVLSPLKVAAVVLKGVLVPLAVGILVRRWAPELARRIARPLARLGIVLLVVSALPLAYASWPLIRALLGNGTVLIVTTMAVIALALGHFLGGPHAHTRTVLALSTTSRHPAVALTVAVGAGGAQAKPALAAILLYVIVAALVSVPYVVWRKRQGFGTHTPITSATRISK